MVVFFSLCGFTQCETQDYSASIEINQNYSVMVVALQAAFSLFFDINAIFAIALLLDYFLVDNELFSLVQ